MDPSMPDAQLLLEHREFLKRLARGILHDTDAAEDIAQEAVLEAIGGRPRNPRGWLGKVARRLALTRRRGELRRAAREQAAARPEALPSAAEGVARLELQRRVVDEVLALDEPYRSVVVHRFFYDLTPTEIARQLGVPLETVRTRLRRALERLRARLDESHGREAWSMALLAIAAPRKLPLGGVVAMSLKSKLVAASLLLIACAFGVSALSHREAPQPRAQPPEARVVEPEAAPAVPFGPPPVDFAAIDRDRDVHGVVVDGSGGVVAGADVRVIRYPAMKVGIGLSQLKTEEGPGARTASDGSFALRVERGEEVDLRVKAGGFVELQRRWCPAGGKVRIVMRKGVSLRVRATGPDGPLAGVHVIAFKGKEPDIEAAGIYVYLLGTTDGEGLCVLSDVLPGREVQVSGWHPDFDLGKPALVRLPETGEAEAALVAERGHDVKGRVTDAVTGAPVAGAAVTPYPVVIPFWKAARTDAEGRYRYGGWTGGERVLFAHAEGYASMPNPVTGLGEVDIALRRGGTVTGIVRDVAGAPVRDAHVGVLDAERTDIRETRSDASGRFELRDVGVGSRTLVAAKPGYGRAQKPVDTPEMEIVLAEPRRLEGRVLGPDGEPLQAKIRVESSLLALRETYERHTDDLGRFRFADLRSGRWNVSVTTSDGRQIGREVTIGDSDVIDLDFQYERGREFSVLVVDEAGRPVPGVDLMSASARRTTDADGRATLEMPKGIDVNQVSVSKVDKRFIRPPVANYKLGQGELTIVLREAVTLSGRVLLDGEPLVAAVVELDGKDFHEITATDKEGKFSRSIPARAEVKVALTGQFAKPAANGRWEDEFLPIYGEETVAPGATEVTIRARRVPLDRTLVVRVTGPDGSPVDGIRLNMNARGFRAEKPPATDAAGRVELTGLPAGEISVGLAVHRAPVPWALPKTMHAKLVPEGQEVVFAFRTAVPITGVVVLADGTRTKAALTAWRGEEYVAHATGEDDGTFAIYIPADEPAAVRLDAMGLPVGPIDVTKKAPPPSRGEVTGVAPGAEGVTIRLRAAD